MCSYSQRYVCPWTLLLVSLLICVACGASQPTLIGTWQKVDGSGFERYIFETDGAAGFGTIGDMCTSRYQFVSSTRIRFTIAPSCAVKELSIEVQVSETTLWLTMADGTTSTYRREPNQGEH